MSKMRIGLETILGKKEELNKVFILINSSLIILQNKKVPGYNYTQTLRLFLL